MNKQQQEMLSVKSAIERTVAGVIAALTASTTDSKGYQHLFSEVERYIASLFVSYQITNNYSVRATDSGDICISFQSIDGHFGVVNYLLPPNLKWKTNANQKQSNGSQETQLKFDHVIDQLREDVKKTIEQQTLTSNTSESRQIIKNVCYQQFLAHGFDTRKMLVVCDETNNPPKTRQQNQVIVEIDTDSNTIVHAFPLLSYKQLPKTDPDIHQAIIYARNIGDIYFNNWEYSIDRIKSVEGYLVRMVKSNIPAINEVDVVVTNHTTSTISLDLILSKTGYKPVVYPFTFDLKK